MKIQLDIQNKTIKIEEDINLEKLIQFFDKILPENSSLGHWREYTIQTNTPVYNWYNPIIYTNYLTNPYPVYVGTNGGNLSNKTLLTEGGNISLGTSNNHINIEFRA